MLLTARGATRVPIARAGEIAARLQFVVIAELKVLSEMAKLRQAPFPSGDGTAWNRNLKYELRLAYAISANRE